MKLSLRITLAIAIVVAVIGSQWLIVKTFKTYRVPTGAMVPTIPIGSHVLAHRTQDVVGGDIIAFRYPLDTKFTYLMRIVARGGDTVEIRDKKLFVNGRELDEPYVLHDDYMVYPRRDDFPEPYRSRDQYGPYRVPADTFFVLGDNRDRSADSRFWGTVPRANVIGRIIATYSLTGFRRVR